MIALKSCLRQREGILRQRAEGTTVLFNLESGEYFALDVVAGRIWELCDGSRSVAEIVSVLAQEYDASAETIADDALALLKEFVDEKLVV